MAEYYYYGVLDKSPNHETAAEMYGKAALAGDPQVRTVHYRKVSILQHTRITQIPLVMGTSCFFYIFISPIYMA